MDLKNHLGTYIEHIKYNLKDKYSCNKQQFFYNSFHGGISQDINHNPDPGIHSPIATGFLETP